jgi:hypothetical protein
VGIAIRAAVMANAADACVRFLAMLRAAFRTVDPFGSLRQILPVNHRHAKDGWDGPWACFEIPLRTGHL